MTTVTLKTHDGRHYLCAEADGRVVADRTEPLSWEHWTVEWVDGGVALKSAHGAYLCAELDGSVVANRLAIGEWEIWQLVETAEGVAFRSHLGGFLCAEEGGGGAVTANRFYENPGAWELFVPSELLTVAAPVLPVAPLSRLRVEDNARWFANDQGRFDWREVSCFVLVGMVLAGRVTEARALLAGHRAMGFTVVRVFVINPIQPYVSWAQMDGFWPALDLAVALCAEAGLYLRASLINATEDFGGVWHPDRRDVWSGTVRSKGEQFAVECAQRLAPQPHVVLELANEPGQIGMRDSFEDLIRLGKKVKAVAPVTLLCAGAVDGPNDQDPRFAVEPFDFCDAHIERRMGVRGFEWVKRSGEYALIDQDHVGKRMPFVSGEPVNFGEPRRDGRNGDVEPSPSVAFAYAAVSRARQFNTCFHYDGGLYGTPPAPATEACIRAYMAALDAFPMLTGSRWRGHWTPQTYWRQSWPPDDDTGGVERHVDAGRGPWRVFGCEDYSVAFPQPQGWDWTANLTARAERVAFTDAGAFAVGVYRRL